MTDPPGPARSDLGESPGDVLIALVEVCRARKVRIDVNDVCVNIVSDLADVHMTARVYLGQPSTARALATLIERIESM